jgi:ADP-heptose:LPS heptosyltransferase
MRQMGAIFKNARLLVTNDSGAMHLAVAVDTPTVTIYGPTRPIDWNPSLTKEAPKNHDVALTAENVDCLGCHRDSCPVGHLCMTKLDEKTVMEAVNKILEVN